MSTLIKPTCQSMLEAIRDSDPADDTPRLAYADYLQENAVAADVPCTGKCHGYRYPGKYPDDIHLRKPTWLDCPDCSGSGTVRVSEDEDRAELIRVQVELRRKGFDKLVHNNPTHRCRVCGAFWVKWQGGGWSICSATCGHCCDNEVMGQQSPVEEIPEQELCCLARESELLARWPTWSQWPCPACKGSRRDDWGRGSGFGDCHVCLGSGDMLQEDIRERVGIANRITRALPDIDWEVGYLFPRSVTVATLGELVGECQSCDGIGEDTRDGQGECRQCHGSGDGPTPRLRALTSPKRWGVPVRAVMAADRVPGHHGGGTGDRAGHWWEPGITSDSSQQIPFFIGEAGVKAGVWRVGFHGGLMVYVPSSGPLRDKGWDTADAANFALGVVLAEFGREEQVV